jgi:subtilisin-like proprotein convertase family protein
VIADLDTLLIALYVELVDRIIWTLKHQFGLEQHNGRVPRGLWTRIVQRLLALNAVIWHNWTIDAPVKRSLIAYDH